MVGKYRLPGDPVETAPWPSTGSDGLTWGQKVRQEVLDGRRSVSSLDQIGKVELFVAFTFRTSDESVPFPRRQQLLAAAILEARPDDFIVELVKVARASFNKYEQRMLLYDKVLGNDRAVDLVSQRGTPAVKQVFTDWESDFAMGGKFEGR